MNNTNLILRKTIAFVAVFLVTYVGILAIHVSLSAEISSLFKVVMLLLSLSTLLIPAWEFWSPKIEKLLKIGKKETVKYKGKQYKILHQAKLKNQTTREWEDVVVYKSTDICKEHLTFVRGKEEFEERFESEN